MPSLRRIQSIFVVHKLYTTKQYYFLRWCKALDIIQDNTLSAQHKHEQLSVLRDQKAPGEYKSQHWECSQPCTDWVSGFVEAEGSFFHNKKRTLPQEKPRFVHAFGITQKIGSSRDGVYTPRITCESKTYTNRNISITFGKSCTPHHGMDSNLLSVQVTGYEKI